MLLKKLYKTRHWLKSNLKEQSYIKEIRAIGHPTLTAVLETFLQVKTSDFDQEDFKIFSTIKKYRNYLETNTSTIDYSVFGIKDRTVNEIYRSASSPEIWSRFHYLLAKNLGVKNYLEIGTNLGISGSYIISALSKQPDFKFLTMEGIEGLSDLAETQFKTLTQPENFEIIRGLYDQTFPELIQKDLNFDVCFIDGNHHYEPTLQYFEKLKEKTAEVAVFIFDDIYWNDEMVKVWEVIKKDKATTFALDLFKMGIIILDQKENRHKTDFNFFLTKI